MTLAEVKSSGGDDPFEDDYWEEPAFRKVLGQEEMKKLYALGPSITQGGASAMVAEEMFRETCSYISLLDVEPPASNDPNEVILENNVGKVLFFRRELLITVEAEDAQKASTVADKAGVTVHGLAYTQQASSPHGYFNALTQKYRAQRYETQSGLGIVLPDTQGGLSVFGVRQIQSNGLPKIKVYGRHFVYPELSGDGSGFRYTNLVFPDKGLAAGSLSELIITSENADIKRLDRILTLKLALA